MVGVGVGGRGVLIAVWRVGELGEGEQGWILLVLGRDILLWFQIKWTGDRPSFSSTSFDLVTLSTDIRVHRAGSQLKTVANIWSLTKKGD